MTKNKLKNRDEFAMVALNEGVMCSDCFVATTEVTVAHDIVPSEVCKWPSHNKSK
jgi:hypothetical protein